jgi:hypothetical protein
MATEWSTEPIFNLPSTVGVQASRLPISMGTELLMEWTWELLSQLLGPAISTTAVKDPYSLTQSSLQKFLEDSKFPGLRLGYHCLAQEILGH